MKRFPYRILLVIVLFVVSIAVFSVNVVRKNYLQKSDTMLFGMRFPPKEKICDYSVVIFWWKDLLNEKGDFQPDVLKTARDCGSKVVVRLSGKSSDLVSFGIRGLDVSRFDDNIRIFKDKIDPFILDGVIIAHLTVDEPHDCQDWGGSCPTFEQLEEASRISKKYWPNLPTMINTVPKFAKKFVWKDTNYLNFQYAYHKGDLSQFIKEGLKVLSDGNITDISWSMQAVTGGCGEYGKCSMTPKQVEKVGTALCQTQRGLYVSFSSYQDKLMTEEMLKTIQRIRFACENRFSKFTYAHGFTSFSSLM